MAALEDTRIVDRFRLILQPSIEGSLDPITGALNDTVADLQQAVSALQSTIRNKDDEILALRREVAEMQSRNDDFEQHSRRASVRVFGVPENTPGSTDDKLLDLCNMGLKLQPPLALEEIEVSHRVGKVIEERVEPSDGQTMTKAKLRPIIVKFVSRRTKARVMAARKILRPKKTKTPTDVDSAPAPATDENVYGDEQTMDNQAQFRRRFPDPVYIADDLTRSRAKLAFCARELLRKRLISETWVFDCSIYIKENGGRIFKVNGQDDSKKYGNR